MLAYFVMNTEICASDCQRAYIIVTSPAKVVELSYLSDRLGLELVAYLENVCRTLDAEGVLYSVAPSGFLSCKRFFLERNPALVIYMTDVLSPHMQWLGKNFQSICLYSRSIDCDRKYYVNMYRYYTKECSGLVGLLHNVFNQKVSMYGANIVCLTCRLSEALRYLYYQVFLGYRFRLGLPGFFSDDIVVSSDEIKKVYIENGIAVEKLHVLGSAVEDVYVNIHNKVKLEKQTKTIDVLLIAQPFYLRGINLWMDEVRLLAKECVNEGLNLVILTHPRDNHTLYSNVDGATVITETRSNEQNMRYIMKAKYVVVKSSTLRLLPILAGVPVFYLNYCDFYPFVDVKSKVIDDMQLNSSGDLKRAIDYSESTDYWKEDQKSILSSVGMFDNNSINRLSLLVDQVLQRTSRK